MNWIEFIGAIGIGAVITKLLDIFWLEKIIEKRERKRWLRNKQLKTFSELSRELLTFRLYKKGVADDYNPFELLAIASQSILLIEDKKLAARIIYLTLRLKEMFNKDISDEKRSQLVNELWKMGSGIVDELRTSLVGNRQKWIEKLFKR